MLIIIIIFVQPAVSKSRWYTLTRSKDETEFEAHKTHISIFYSMMKNIKKKRPIRCMEK